LRGKIDKKQGRDFVYQSDSSLPRLETHAPLCLIQEILPAATGRALHEPEIAFDETGLGRESFGHESPTARRLTHRVIAEQLFHLSVDETIRPSASAKTIPLRRFRCEFKELLCLLRSVTSMILRPGV
jgi:hypothetical protein